MFANAIVVPGHMRDFVRDMPVPPPPILPRPHDMWDAGVAHLHWKGNDDIDRSRASTNVQWRQS
eukprot:10878595-Alexandrium_andersonii.AAC.1